MLQPANLSPFYSLLPPSFPNAAPFKCPFSGEVARDALPGTAAARPETPSAVGCACWDVPPWPCPGVGLRPNPGPWSRGWSRVRRVGAGAWPRMPWVWSRGWARVWAGALRELCGREALGWAWPGGARLGPRPRPDAPRPHPEPRAGGRGCSPGRQRLSAQELAPLGRSGRLAHRRMAHAAP